MEWLLPASGRASRNAPCHADSMGRDLQVRDEGFVGALGMIIGADCIAEWMVCGIIGLRVEAS